MTSTNPIVANALSRNATFKVGDKVRRGKEVGVVKGVVNDPYMEVKFPNEPVTIFVHKKELAVINAENATEARNAVTNDWKSYETAADIIKYATQAAQELEAMVKKATPWRAEMGRMRQRADKLNDAYYGISSIDKGDPLYGKAVDAVKRWEKARAAAGELWFSI